MIELSMMSAKLATLGLLKIKVFHNKDFLSITLLTKFYHMTQIVS